MLGEREAQAQLPRVGKAPVVEPPVQLQPQPFAMETEDNLDVFLTTDWFLN